MFARVFDTAKRILSRSPSYQGQSSEARDIPTATSDPSATMVTTRGGIETPGSTATPVSSAKKRTAKRELDVSETPTQAKRQKKATPVSRKKVVEETPQPEEDTLDSTEDSSDTIAVSAPAHNTRARQTSANNDLLPIRPRSSPKVVVANISLPVGTETEAGNALVSATETDHLTPKQSSGSTHTTPVTRKQAEGSPTPKAKASKAQTPTSAKRGRGRPKKVHAEEEPSTLEVTQTVTKVLNDQASSIVSGSAQAPIASQGAVTVPSQPKKAHMRFGSEEPVESGQSIIINGQGHERYDIPESTLKAPASEAAQDDEDDASDSDEAPEIVTTAAAASKAQVAQAEADRALQAQEAKEQAKRQARDELIAAQQAAKREREEKKAKKLAKQAVKQQKLTAPPSEEDEGPSATVLPVNGLLPDSFLATIDDQRPPTPTLQRRGKTEEELRREKLNHHIKFLERTDKPAKDLKKGKLSVAVLGQQNRVLPPKANRDTKNVREQWLKGRKADKKKGGKANVRFGKMERRRVGGGFLRGDD